MVLSNANSEKLAASARRLTSPKTTSHSSSVLWLVNTIALCALAALVYHSWINMGIITAGDFPYFTLTHLREGLALPPLWEPEIGTGTYNILALPMYPISLLQGLFASFGGGWGLCERVFWVGPAVLIPCIGTYLLAWALWQKHLTAIIAAFASITNSYIYLLYQGGQFGVAIGYGCLPLVLWAFLRGRTFAPGMRYSIVSLCFALQAMYDVRSTYITIFLCLLLLAYRVGKIPPAMSIVSYYTQGLAILIVALLLTLCLHAWWILPTIFVATPSLPHSYTNIDTLHALSFMHLDNGLTLFHPFWFSNDGHLSSTPVMFFIVPFLIIFSILLRCDRQTLYLLSIALVGIFLVKGDNDPLGIIYDWLFVHAPGFSLFRDPSKFYQPIAICYALLLGNAATRLHFIVTRATRTYRFSGVLIAIVFITVAALPASPALLEQGKGTFQSVQVTADYVTLNTLIDEQATFFRVLWVPARPRFGVTTIRHPALDAAQGPPCCGAQGQQSMQNWTWILNPNYRSLLRHLSIKYIVVPNLSTLDVIGVPNETIDKRLSSTGVVVSLRGALNNWKEETIGQVHVFVNNAADQLLCVQIDHRWSRSCQVPSNAIPSQTSLLNHANSTFWHEVHITGGAHAATIFFAQAYDPNWWAFQTTTALKPWQTIGLRPLPITDHYRANGYANAWLVHNRGSYYITLVYWPERFAVLGLIITGAVFTFCILVALISYRRTRGMRLLKETPLHLVDGAN